MAARKLQAAALLIRNLLIRKKQYKTHFDENLKKTIDQNSPQNRNFPDTVQKSQAQHRTKIVLHIHCLCGCQCIPTFYNNFTKITSKIQVPTLRKLKKNS